MPRFDENIYTSTYPFILKKDIVSQLDDYNLTKKTILQARLVGNPITIIYIRVHHEEDNHIRYF